MASGSEAKRGARGFALKRIILWLSMGIIGLILLALLLTQTGFFRSWIRDFIVDTANESLAGKLLIEDLDGNLFTNFTLSGITVILNADTIISVGTVYAEYDILSAFVGKIEVESLTIDSIYLDLVQREDSSWNVAYLMPIDTIAQSDSEDSDGEGFDYPIEVRNFEISQVSADIQGLNPMIPRRLEDLSLQLFAVYASDIQKLDLRRFSLEMNNPTLKITDLHFKAEADSDKYSLVEFVLATGQNRIEAEGAFHLDQPANSYGRIISAPIVLKEFEVFLPEVVSGFEGEIVFTTTLSHDTIESLVQVKRFDEGFNLVASLQPASSLLDSSSQMPARFSSNLNFKELDLGEWLQDPTLDIILNGTVKALGSGLDPNEIKADISADFADTRIHGQRLARFGCDIGYSKGDAGCSLEAGGQFGQISVLGNLRNLLDTPGVDLAISMDNIDLRQLKLIDTLDTDINARLHLTGSGATAEDISGSAELSLLPSKIMWMDVTGGQLNAMYSRDRIDIDTLSIVTNIADFNASGKIGQSGEGLLRYAARIHDSTVLAEMLGEDDVQIQGDVAGSLTGSFSQQQVIAAVQFSDIRYGDVSIASVTSDMSAGVSDTSITSQVSVLVTEIESAGMLLDSISVAGSYDGGLTSVDVFVAHPLVLCHTQADVALDSLIRIAVNTLDIQYGDVNWTNAENIAEIDIDSMRYSVNDLYLTSDEGDGQQISIDGTVDFDNTALLTVEVNGLDVAKIGIMIDLDVSGLLSSKVSLSSPLAAPGLTGQYELIQGRLERFPFNGLFGEFSLADSVASLYINFKPTVHDSLVVTGSIPVLIGPDSFGLDDNGLLSIQVVGESLPLKIFEANGEIIEDADGLIDCNISISQSLKDPAIDGSLTIRNGVLKVPEFGVDYRDIQVGFSFLPNRVNLDSISMRQDRGSFRIAGHVGYDSSIIDGNIQSSHIELLSDRFFVVRHSDYEVQLTSNIKAEGCDSSLSYSGAVTVDRSRFYLPAFMTDAESVDDLTMPLLVEATTDSAIDSKLGKLLETEGVRDDSLFVALMKRISGRITLTLPKNTWVKAPGVSLELAGDLEVVQDGSEPELFGDVRVVRGYYELFGKRLNVQKGRVIFQGGSYLDPTLDIEALYVLRTPTREKKNLRLYVTGTAEAPILSFTLDQAEIGEGDAVSYLVFSRSLDELSQRQQATTEDKKDTRQIAGAMAAKMLAGQLSGVLGSTFNMDVMEIKTSGDMESAAIVVGKYITPDLFMSYQRSFGSSLDDDLEPEIVTLEYQLTKLLYLQLTEGDAEEAGVDIIFKFEKD